MSNQELYDRQVELAEKTGLTDEETAELYAIDAMLDARS